MRQKGFACVRFNFNEVGRQSMREEHRDRRLLPWKPSIYREIIVVKPRLRYSSCKKKKKNVTAIFPVNILWYV